MRDITGVRQLSRKEIKVIESKLQVSDAPVRHREHDYIYTVDVFGKDLKPQRVQAIGRSIDDVASQLKVKRDFIQYVRKEISDPTEAARVRKLFAVNMAVEGDGMSRQKINRSEKGGSMSEGTADALKAFRSKEDSAKPKKERAAKPGESAEERENSVKTATKEKSQGKKVPTKSTRKPAVKVEKAESKRGSIFIFGHPVTAVLRWMGEDAFSVDEAKQALKAGKVSKMPSDSTISIQVNAGKRRGEVPKLTAEQQKILRDAAKKVSAEAAKEAK